MVSFEHRAGRGGVVVGACASGIPAFQFLTPWSVAKNFITIAKSRGHQFISQSSRPSRSSLDIVVRRGTATWDAALTGGFEVVDVA